MRRSKDYSLAQTRPAAHDHVNKATLYTSIKIRLTDALKLQWREHGRAELSKNSPECKAMFKQMSESEFVKLLEQATGNTDLEHTKTHFVLKKAYPVCDRASLQAYMFKHLRCGFPDDEKLEMCYKGILDDVQRMISEGWLRVVDYFDSNSRKQTDRKRILFPCDLSVEYESQPVLLGKRCHDYIAGVWADQLGQNAITNWEKIL